MSPQRIGWLGLILAGATLGTSVRAALEAAWPSAPGVWPWTTFWINLGGSFVLGVLLEWLVRGGEDTGWRRGVRLGVGTGVLGGFTTYSTFAVETVSAAGTGAVLVGLGYALASVVGGTALAASGMLLVRRLAGAR